MEQERCLNCKLARQVGDKSRVDVVGCIKMADDDFSEQYEYTGLLYSGYLYVGRRPGDVEEPKEFNKGRLILGYVVEADAICKNYLLLN